MFAALTETGVKLSEAVAPSVARRQREEGRQIRDESESESGSVRLPRRRSNAKSGPKNDQYYPLGSLDQLYPPPISPLKALNPSKKRSAERPPAEQNSRRRAW